MQSSSLYNFKEIKTKNKNGIPIIPKGFGESPEASSLKPTMLVSSLKVETGRKFTTVRKEAGERVLSGTEGDTGQTGQPEATKAEGDVESQGPEQMFMPLSKDELLEPLKREDGPFGLDILYNDSVILVGPQYYKRSTCPYWLYGRVGRGRFVVYDRNECNGSGRD